MNTPEQIYHKVEQLKTHRAEFVTKWREKDGPSNRIIVDPDTCYWESNLFDEMRYFSSRIGYFRTRYFLPSLRVPNPISLPTCLNQEFNWKVFEEKAPIPRLFLDIGLADQHHFEVSKIKTAMKFWLPTASTIISINTTNPNQIRQVIYEFQEVDYIKNGWGPCLIGKVISSDDMGHFGYKSYCSEISVRHARVYKDSGASGVLAPLEEVANIRSECGDDFLILTEVSDIEEGTTGNAVLAGADYVIIPMSKIKEKGGHGHKSNFPGSQLYHYSVGKTPEIIQEIAGELGRAMTVNNLLTQP